MSGGRPMVNPYAKRRPLGAHNSEIMGRQSQQRVSNTKRAHQLAASNSFKKRSKGGKLKITGGVAFDSFVNCEVCVAQASKRFFPEVRIPHWPHHVLCAKNKEMQGKGLISQQQRGILKEEKYLQKLYSMPLQSDEKGSSAHLTPTAGEAFFRPRKSTTKIATTKKDDPCLMSR